MSQEPGWYHAEGDPAGTMRYWDGSQWVGEPTTQTPTYAAAGSRQFGGAGERLGARIIDAIILIIVNVILVALFIGFDDFTATGGGSIGVILISLILGILYEIGLVATRGATLGKQILNLQVTDESFNSPPGWGPAAMRWLPALAGVIPGIGALIGLVLGIASGVMISNDDQNRSVQDRIGKTHVIKTK